MPRSLRADRAGLGKDRPARQGARTKRRASLNHGRRTAVNVSPPYRNSTLVDNGLADCSAGGQWVSRTVTRDLREQAEFLGQYKRYRDWAELHQSDADQLDQTGGGCAAAFALTLIPSTSSSTRSTIMTSYDDWYPVQLLQGRRRHRQPAGPHHHRHSSGEDAGRTVQARRVLQGGQARRWC